MTDDELKKIEERANAATPGPRFYAAPYSGVVVADNFTEAQTYSSILEPGVHLDLPENLEFAAHSRTDVPALISALREAQEALRQCWGQEHNIDCALEVNGSEDGHECTCHVMISRKALEGK
jgi:hypothetical protein